MRFFNDRGNQFWLVTATAQALAWFFRIQGVYLRGQPLATISLIAALLGERVFGLLAFFLPLKVLLLAGSEGVPKYFAFFMEVEDKPFWLAVLAACSVVFYLVAVVLEKLSATIAESAGEGVLMGANAIYVTSVQRKEASTYFLQFATISASATLLALSLLVMGAINFWLPIILLVLMVLEFFFPAAVVQRTVSKGRPVSESWITTSWQGYLSACRSINFLSGFGVLLASFMLGAQGNVIWAVLAIIILRQSLTAGASVVGLLIGLYRKRASIDPLTFRESRLVRQDVPESRDFRVLFAHERRDEMIRELLDGLGYREVAFNSSYRDGAHRGVYEFLIDLDNGSEVLLLNVFSKQSTNLLEHENLLFDYVSRDQVHAPPVLAEFLEGPFRCQLLQLGGGQFISSGEWQSLVAELYSSQNSLSIPDRLAEDYLISHQTIEDRITDDLVSRTAVALDTFDQRETFEKFRERIPELRKLLRAVPIRLQNRDFLPRNFIGRDDDRPMTTNWRRWSVDRIGSVSPPGFQDDELAQIGRDLIRGELLTSSFGEEGGVELLLLVRDAVALEQAVQAESFNLALRKMQQILVRMDCIQHSVRADQA